MPRFPIALPLLLLALACADSTSVDLPRLATVGAMPAELGLDHVVVTVAAQGRIFTPDGETDPAALAVWLRPHAERSRDDSHPARPSNVHLLVRVDAEVRWTDLVRVLEAAAQPENRVNRVVFAVRSTDPADPEEGSFAFFLPLDRGLSDAGESREAAETVGSPAEMILQGLLSNLERMIASGVEPSVCLVPQDVPGIRLWNREKHEWVPFEPLGLPDELPVRREPGLVGITEFPCLEEPILLAPGLYRDGDDDPPFEERPGK